MHITERRAMIGKAVSLACLGLLVSFGPTRGAPAAGDDADLTTALMSAVPPGEPAAAQLSPPEADAAPIQAGASDEPMIDSVSGVQGFDGRGLEIWWDRYHSRATKD